jgi:hypothetical protein
LSARLRLQAHAEVHAGPATASRNHAGHAGASSGRKLNIIFERAFLYMLFNNNLMHDLHTLLNLPAGTHKQ